MSEFITFKRWSLREGREESELVKLVREEIIPHYEKIPGFLRLGLLDIVGTRSYLVFNIGKIMMHFALRTSPTTTGPGIRHISQCLSAGTN